MSAAVVTIVTPAGAIAYREDGPTDASALLLCQRFRGTMEDWDPRFIAALATRRRVIRFDMPGTGGSTGIMPDSVPAMAAIVPQLLDGLGLDCVDLLGWSLGGYVALTVALEAGHRLRRLVVAGSGPGGPDAPPAHPRVAAIAEKEAPSRDEIAFLFFPDTPEGNAIAAEHLDQIRYGQRDPVPQVSGLRQRAAIIQWTKGLVCVKPRLGELTLPMLVANGIDDVMVPAENSFIIARSVQDAKLVLYPRAGHGFLFQYFDAFADEVERFLSSPALGGGEPRPLWPSGVAGVQA